MLQLLLLINFAPLFSLLYRYPAIASCHRRSDVMGEWLLGNIFSEAGSGHLSHLRTDHVVGNKQPHCPVGQGWWVIYSVQRTSKFSASYYQWVTRSESATCRFKGWTDYLIVAWTLLSVTSLASKARSCVDSTMRYACMTRYDVVSWKADAGWRMEIPSVSGPTSATRPRASVFSECALSLSVIFKDIRGFSLEMVTDRLVFPFSRTPFRILFSSYRSPVVYNLEAKPFGS